MPLGTFAARAKLTQFPCMDEFDELRRRYEVTPRVLDDRLRARLPEAPSSQTTVVPKPSALPPWVWVLVGAGAPLAGLAFFLLLQRGLPYDKLPVIAGGALVVIGTLGWLLLRSRTRNEGGERRLEELILEQGPLVLGHLVRADERLWQPGAPPGRALVLFSLDPARRFDRTYLDRLVSEIQVLRGGTMPDMALVDVWRMVNSDKATGAVPVPEQVAGNARTHLAAMTVVPKWLERGRLTSRSLLCVAHPKGRRLMQI